jgi:hypothetical protein
VPNRTTSTSKWSAFFEAWHALLGDSAVSSRDLAAIYLDDNRLGWFEQFSSAAATVFRESLPPDLEPTTDKERCEFSRKLGYALRARCDRIFGKIRLVRGVAAGSSHGNSVQWQVVLVAQSRARTYPRANNAKTSPALPATSPGQTQNDTSEPLVVPVDEALSQAASRAVEPKPAGDGAGDAGDPETITSASNNACRVQNRSSAGDAGDVSGVRASACAQCSCNPSPPPTGDGPSVESITRGTDDEIQVQKTIRCRRRG